MNGELRTVNMEKWEDCRALLAIMANWDGEEESRRWYCWRIDIDGITWVVPLRFSTLPGVLERAPEMQGAAALYGECCGLGVAPAGGEPLALSAYTPYRWPVVPMAQGKERMVYPKHPSGAELRALAWHEGVEYPFQPRRRATAYKSGN